MHSVLWWSLPIWQQCDQSCTSVFGFTEGLKLHNACTRYIQYATYQIQASICVLAGQGMECRHRTHEHMAVPPVTSGASLACQGLRWHLPPSYLETMHPCTKHVDSFWIFRVLSLDLSLVTKHGSHAHHRFSWSLCEKFLTWREWLVSFLTISQLSDGFAQGVLKASTYVKWSNIFWDMSWPVLGSPDGGDVRSSFAKPNLEDEQRGPEVGETLVVWLHLWSIMWWK